MTKRERSSLIEHHVATKGVTVCPDGSAIKPSLKKEMYWGKRGQGGRRSARSPFFVRGEGCV